MKRFLSMLLVVVMIITSSVMILSSCNKEEKEDDKPTTENNSGVSTDEDDIFAERAAVDDELGEYDFGGRQLRIVSHRTDEYWIEEDQRNKGDLIADAKYNRNKTVEDRFNFEIAVAYQAPYYEVNDWVSKTVLSGSDEFDLFCSHSHYSGSVVRRMYSLTGMIFRMLTLQSLGGLRLISLILHMTISAYLQFLILTIFLTQRRFVCSLIRILLQRMTWEIFMM